MSTTARVGIDLLATDKTQSAFNSVNRSAKNLMGTLDTLKSFAVGFAAAFSFQKVISIFGETIQSIEDIGHAAQSIGIPTLELSKLKYAADLSNIATESLYGSVKILTKNLEAVSSGANNGTAAALKALGISATDANGKLLPTEETIRKISAAFASFKDGPEKTALAVALFGKSGNDLIPMLNEGADGLKKLGAQAVETGNAFDDRASIAADTFNDRLDLIKKKLVGSAATIAMEFLPELDRLAQAVGELAINDWATSFADGVRVEFQDAQRMIEALVGVADKAGVYFTAIGADIKQVLSGDFTGSVKRWEDVSRSIEQITAKTKANIAFIGQSSNLSGKGDLNMNVAPKPSAPTFTHFIEENNAAASAVKKLNDELEKQKKKFDGEIINIQQYVSGVSTETQALGLNAGALARLNESQKIYNSLKDAGVKLSSANITEIETELNKIPLAVANLERMKDAMALSQSIGQTFESSFSSSFSSFINGTMSIADATKSMVSSMLQSLTSLFANRAFSMLIGGGVGSGGTGGLIGSIFSAITGGAGALGGFSGLYANGGTLGAGKWGIAGESGAEVVKGPATIIPMSAMGRQSPSVTIIDQRNNAPAIEEQQQPDGSTRFIVRDQLVKSINRGEADSAMRNRSGIRTKRTMRG